MCCQISLLPPLHQCIDWCNAPSSFAPVSTRVLYALRFINAQCTDNWYFVQLVCRFMKSTDVLRTGVHYVELKALLRARVAISFLFPSIKQHPARYGAHTVVSNCEMIMVSIVNILMIGKVFLVVVVMKVLIMKRLYIREITAARESKHRR